MIDIRDRVVEHPNRYKLTLVSGETDVFDVESSPGVITEAGTNVNRTLMMAFQGFYGNETVFNVDGSITETNPDGDTKVTTFNVDGSISEVFTSGLVSIEKLTTFNVDGSITEELI